MKNLKPAIRQLIKDLEPSQEWLIYCARMAKKAKTEASRLNWKSMIQFELDEAERLKPERTKIINFLIIQNDKNSK